MGASNDSRPSMCDRKPLTLTRLPAELIDYILCFLSPYDLVDVSSTCRLLHNHTGKDSLWQAFVQSNVAIQLSSPGPCPSFKDLYIQHHPRWFLTKNKIWFSDHQHSGKLLFARYDQRQGCIEAYSVTAERGPHRHGTLDWDGQVEYKTFCPKFLLDLNLPVIHLEVDLDRDRNTRFNNEVPMSHTSVVNRITSTFLHTRFLPESLATWGTSVWPPLTISSPGNQRTRNESNSTFHATGHRPSKLTEASDATFRIRQWVEFSHFIPGQPVGRGGSRVAEIVSTWATIPEECYTPTKQKPWQGIWCGDYSGHGCEFLLITQPDDPKPLPEKARKAFAMWPHTDVDLYGHYFADEDDSDDDDDEDVDEHWVGDVAPTNAAAARRFLRSRRISTDASPEDVAPYKGRLEAVKLTGDPNVPRGEITFIAEDLGARGLVGFAQEDLFIDHCRDATKEDLDVDDNGEGSSSAGAATQSSMLRPDFRGARIVKAVGHIAGQGFTRDAYIPSRMIMISENRLAQYWLHYGYVSFYERVDLDQFLKV